MSATEDVGKWLERARGGVATAQASGIVPTRVTRAADGSLVPPVYAPWVPWIPVALITVICGVAGHLANDQGAGAVMGVVAGLAVAVAPYYLHPLPRVLIVLAVALIMTNAIISGAMPVVAGAALIWFLPARVYHQAAFDAEAIHRAATAAEWAAQGAKIFVVVEVIDRERTDGAKLRLDPAGRGVPVSRIVRALPGDCKEGALLALDSSGTCLETMPADMHERFRTLEETVR